MKDGNHFQTFLVLPEHSAREFLNFAVEPDMCHACITFRTGGKCREGNCFVALADTEQDPADFFVAAAGPRRCSA